MIAINGMKTIPKSCSECPLLCGLSGEQGCSVTGEPYFSIKECPLKEIVICKDCKHREKVHPHWLSNKKAKVYFCTLHSDESCYEVEDDHFCADGERKE